MNGLVGDSAAERARARHMVVCGDDGLAQRLAFELAARCGEQVTMVTPRHVGQGYQEMALPREAIRVVESRRPDDTTLLDAGIEDASALALVYGDDQTNIQAALRARELNPEIRLVIRMFNRQLGRYVENLLDRAIEAHAPGRASSMVDVSTTVLSDVRTAAPELVAAAFDGSSNAIPADGLLLHPAYRPAGAPARAGDLCVLAVMSGSAADDPDSEDSAEHLGEGGTQLLPDDRPVAQFRPDHGIVVLEAITENAPQEPEAPEQARRGRWRRAAREWAERLPIGILFSRKVRLVVGLMLLFVTVMSLINWTIVDGSLAHAAHLTLLDVFTMGDPAIDAPAAREVMQLVAGFAGVAFLPVLLAAVLDAMGAFRVASTNVRPPTGLSDHVVLIGLGKVGMRVLRELHGRKVDVVCVDRDPQARGMALARSLKVPTLVADAMEPEVLEQAGLRRSRALLALTSVDSTNLEAVLRAREAKPDLRVVMRLFDDRFAATVNKALRQTYPNAVTRSRSVTSLSASAFAAAMMGRHVLGVMPVERGVLLFTAVEVRDHPELEGRTVADAFRPGQWRVIARDTAPPADRSPHLGPDSSTSSYGQLRLDRPELDWHLRPGHVLRAEDRVVLATTRAGLNVLLDRDQRRRTADPSAC
jgi:Trk K+ transport system NAD-binding subunit